MHKTRIDMVDFLIIETARTTEKAQGNKQLHSHDLAKRLERGIHGHHASVEIVGKEKIDRLDDIIAGAQVVIIEGNADPSGAFSTNTQKAIDATTVQGKPFVFIGAGGTTAETLQAARDMGASFADTDHRNFRVSIAPIQQALNASIRGENATSETHKKSPTPWKYGG